MELYITQSIYRKNTKRNLYVEYSIILKLCNLRRKEKSEFRANDSTSYTNWNARRRFIHAVPVLCFRSRRFHLRAVPECQCVDDSLPAIALDATHSCLSAVQLRHAAEKREHEHAVV